MKNQKTMALLTALVLLVGIFAYVPAGAVDASRILTVQPNAMAVVEDLPDQATMDALIASHTDANGKTFVSVALEDDPGSMNPYGSGASKPRMVVLEGIYEGLFCIQGTGGELKPVLADSYSVSDDGYTYTIKLKDYIVDSMGNPFTASDVKFVLETVARDEYKWSSSKYYDAVNVVDDYTVEIVFNTKMYNYVVNSLIAYMFTEKAYTTDSADKMITDPIGTGPYALTAWTSGTEMVFETYGSYWETDPSKIYRNSYANVDKIIYKIIKDSAQRVIALESQSVDICTGVSPTDLELFKDNDDFLMFQSLQDQVVSLAFNCNEISPLSDVRVRQAIAYAIDAQGVLDGVDLGNGELCYTAFCRIFPDYDPAWEGEDYYGYDPGKAKELLKAAGWDGSKEITIVFENNDRLANVAVVLQAYLAEVGITMNIVPCDGALFRTYRFDKTQGDIKMFTAGSSTFGSSSLIGNLNAVAEDKSLITTVEETLWGMIVPMAENAYKDWSYAHDLHYYVKDNVYIYSLYAPINFTVTSKVLTGFILNQKGKDSPNCCTYIWN